MERHVNKKRILFLRTYWSKDVDRALILALSLAAGHFGRIVVVGKQEGRSDIELFWDLIFGEDYDDDENARFEENIEYVASDDRAWRATIHAEIAKADCIVLYLSPKSKRFPQINIPSTFDEYWRTPLSEPSSGRGLLYEIAFLQRLDRLYQTFVIVEERHAAYIDTLMHHAEAGDVFRLSEDPLASKPLAARLSALDKQLANLQEARGFFTITLEELASPLAGLVQRLDAAILEIIGTPNISSGAVASIDPAQLTGRSPLPRRLPPDNEEKIIQYTNVEDLLYIPQGRIADLSRGEVRSRLHPEAVAYGCGHCQGPIDEILFFTDVGVPSSSILRGKCQQCGGYDSY